MVGICLVLCCCCCGVCANDADARGLLLCLGCPGEPLKKQVLWYMPVVPELLGGKRKAGAGTCLVLCLSLSCPGEAALPWVACWCLLVLPGTPLFLPGTPLSLARYLLVSRGTPCPCPVPPCPCPVPPCPCQGLSLPVPPCPCPVPRCLRYLLVPCPGPCPCRYLLVLPRTLSLARTSFSLPGASAQPSPVRTAAAVEC
jgi:hypothetical protein